MFYASLCVSMACIIRFRSWAKCTMRCTVLVCSFNCPSCDAITCNKMVRYVGDWVRRIMFRRIPVLSYTLLCLACPLGVLHDSDYHIMCVVFVACTLKTILGKIHRPPSNAFGGLNIRRHASDLCGVQDRPEFPASSGTLQDRPLLTAIPGTPLCQTNIPTSPRRRCDTSGLYEQTHPPAPSWRLCGTWLAMVVFLR